MKKGRKDYDVFQILAALLHSNPILKQHIRDFCQENQISMVEKAKLIDIMELLAQETSDEKVKDYCHLLLTAKKKNEAIN